MHQPVDRPSTRSINALTAAFNQITREVGTLQAAITVLNLCADALTLLREEAYSEIEEADAALDDMVDESVVN